MLCSFEVSNLLNYGLSAHYSVIKYTQPDGTVFFLIFTYLRGRSHWNSRDYGSNVAICHFLKPATNKGDFRLYFLLVEKSCRGRHHSEILKTNTKTLIYSIWIRPQGSLGCQKVRQGPLNMLFEVWRANIAPKMKKIWKSQRKQGFFDIFSSILMIFEVYVLWGQSYPPPPPVSFVKKKIQFFDTPGTPGGGSIWIWTKIVSEPAVCFGPLSW